MKIQMQKQDCSEDNHIIEVTFDKGPTMNLSVLGAKEASDVYRAILYAYEAGYVYGAVNKAVKEASK